jgi:hypothetical protein
LSSTEQEARYSFANELFEKSGDHRVEVNLTTAICCFEPLFDPAVMNFLLDKDGQKVRGDVLVNLDAERLTVLDRLPGPEIGQILSRMCFLFSSPGTSIHHRTTHHLRLDSM